MSTIAKTIVATGATSGIGFEAVKQLLSQSQPYNFILGARDVKTSTDAYDGLKYDNSKHRVTILPLELTNMNSVKTFAQQTLEKLDTTKIDYLMLNAGAGMSKTVAETGPYGSKWIEPYLINHLSQHYLTHLLQSKLEESKTRVVVVSSGAIQMVKDPNTLESAMLSSTPTTDNIYPATKFIQLLNAHWWRRRLRDSGCVVVAVSPGMIPNTGLGRGSGMKIPDTHPDAKSVPDGARSVLAAFTRDDLPQDEQQIFLTSWGEWWPKDVYKLTLDEELQERWSPSREEIERDEGVSA